jgi:exosome complex component RRP4
MEKKSELLVKERQLVTPGDVMARGLEYLPGSGCYRKNSDVRSKLLGLVRLKERVVGVVPLSGVYIPKAGDGIIATVTDLQSTFWILDLNSPYDAILQLGEATAEYVDTTKTDLSVYFDIGDVVYVKVLSVSRSKHVTLTMNDYRAKKLIGGRIMKVTPSKVPRIIGKEGSMIELIKKYTGCNIVVGQNGIVWLKGSNEALAAKAVLMIEREAHISGLTDRVTAMLKEDGTPAEENAAQEGGVENE